MFTSPGTPDSRELDKRLRPTNKLHPKFTPSHAPYSRLEQTRKDHRLHGDCLWSSSPDLGLFNKATLAIQQGLGPLLHP
jgi:hypothetical protein